VSGLKALARKVRTPDAEPQPPMVQSIASWVDFKTICASVERLVASVPHEGKVEVDSDAGTCYIRESVGHLCLWEIVLRNKRVVTLAVHLPHGRKANDQGLSDAEVEASINATFEAMARLNAVLSAVVARKAAGWLD